MKTTIQTPQSAASMLQAAEALRNTLALNVLVLIGLALLATGLFAQAPPTGANRLDPQKITERRVQNLKKALKLTNEQVGKIQPIILKGAEAGKKIFDEKKGDRKAAAEAMKANMEATDSEIRTILTPEQLTKFDKMRDKMKEKMTERMKERAEKRAAKKAEK